jgi:hypothetical protein
VQYKGSMMVASVLSDYEDILEDSMPTELSRKASLLPRNKRPYSAAL